MKEILKNADSMLARMVVSGDNVMLLAAARSALVSAFNELEKEEKNASDDGK